MGRVAELTPGLQEGPLRASESMRWSSLSCSLGPKAYPADWPNSGPVRAPLCCHPARLHGAAEPSGALGGVASGHSQLPSALATPPLIHRDEARLGHVLPVLGAPGRRWRLGHRSGDAFSRSRWNDRPALALTPPMSSQLPLPARSAEEVADPRYALLSTGASGRPLTPGARRS
jgi:hypothetical protein